MKVFKTEEYLKLKTPVPEQSFMPEILSSDQGEKRLGGMFGLLVAGGKVPLHSHLHRETVIIAIGGEGVAVGEGKEIPIKAGDIVFIPAGERHATENRSSAEFRYISFYTHPPLDADFVDAR